MKKLILGLLILMLINGCTTPSSIPTTSESSDEQRKEAAKMKCVQACMGYTEDLSNGPCLSNKIEEEWVCDVAHSPRQAVDNLEENQCSEYGKTAAHFVEVDENCKFIQAV